MSNISLKILVKEDYEKLVLRRAEHVTKINSTQINPGCLFLNLNFVSQEHYLRICNTLGDMSVVLAMEKV